MGIWQHNVIFTPYLPFFIQPVAILYTLLNVRLRMARRSKRGEREKRQTSREQLRDKIIARNI